MPANESNSDFQTLSPSKKNDGGQSNGQNTLKPPKSKDQKTLRPASQKKKKDFSEDKGLINLQTHPEKGSLSAKSETKNDGLSEADTFSLQPKQDSSKPKKEPQKKQEKTDSSAQNIKKEYEPTYAEKKKIRKKQKQVQRDEKLIKSDNWLLRDGHMLTYIGLYLFSVMAFYRPYELFPDVESAFFHMQFLEGTAVYFAGATLALYFPIQYLTDGDFTVFTTEVKCILVMTVLSIVTIGIAKDRALAYEEFTDQFIKSVLMFIVLVNVMRTRKRLMGMMWLSISIGVYLSYKVWMHYINDELVLQGERYAVDLGGLWGNPNDMALHIVTVIPLVIAIGVSSRTFLMKIICFLMTGLFGIGIFVSDSRGGFIGLAAISLVLAWKLGRKYRAKVTVLSVFAGICAMAVVLSSGKYRTRLLSIFIPNLDPTGSANERTALLKRSILVTLRNPWGVGLGNFTVFGYRNLQTHNAYTQVSSELGIIGLLAYLIFMISPFRKLGAIERKLFDQEKLDWFYYMAIGLQVSIIGFMVTSFFLSVAYNWYIYYLIAYAVVFRRIYQKENKIEEKVKGDSLTERLFGLRLKSI